MNNSTILRKAMLKAKDNGWKCLSHFHVIYIDTDLKDELENPLRYSYIRAVIFDPEFAKALWGEETWVLTDLGEWIPPERQGVILGAEELPAWQYHLQQMVISKDPIKYIGENL